MNHKFRGTSSILALMIAMSGGTAHAQDATPNAEAVTELDEVVVTGSRIRRTNLNTAIPMQTLGVDDIEAVGTNEIGAILAEIPGVDFGVSPENTTLSTQNPGLSSINLRGLGDDRSLTLINGRRAISNSGNGERVSTETIPAGFVQRLEVTTGGASAIYGADAIAGVVNILLRKDFEGVKTNYRYSTADASGEDQHTIDVTLGTNFSDGRGNIMVGVSYDHETAVKADSTRPGTLLPISFDNDGTNWGVSLSSNLNGGRFEGDDAWNIGGVWYNDKSLLPEGRTAAEAFETDLDGFNYREGRDLSPAREVISTATVGHYEITENTTLSAELYFTRVNTNTIGSANTANSGTDVGLPGETFDIGTISSSNPFIPAEVEETRSGTVSWVRRFAEVGVDDKSNQRDTLRSAISLDGSFDNGWAWNSFASFGRFTQDQHHNNEINKRKIHYALNVEADGNGGYQCQDADARADGCIPLNIFGEGSITPAMADYIRANGHLTQNREQYVVGGSVNGDLFDLGSGTVKSAAGVEYRKETQQTVGDKDALAGDTTTSIIPDIDASFDVIEAYAEVDVPVTDTLSLQLASRIGEYSTIGTIFSYNVGGSWAPTPDIRFRAQYSRSQRAPNITEFFSDKRGDYDDLDDPCQGVMPDGSGVDATYSANCLAEAGIQAYFANPDNAGEAFDDGRSSIFAPNAGNDQLKEETASTYTAGVVLTPEALPNFSLVADYYQITINGAIGSVSTQDVADLCYGSADFPNNRFCDVITRDASNGAIVELVNRDENLNTRKVAGVDVNLKYKHETDNAGDFSLSVIYNHVFTNEVVFEGLNGPELTVFNGEIDNPKDRAKTSLSWDMDNFRVSYTWRYSGAAIDDITTVPTDPDYFKIGAESFHDIYMSYKFEDMYGLQLYGGVKNFTNNFGPLVPSGLDYGSTRNYPATVHNNLIGREFYLGVRARF